jgi:hypothetical protein
MKNHEYEPQSKLWKQIPQQAAGYYTLRFAGLFNLPISLHFVMEIGVSRINNILHVFSSKKNLKYFQDIKIFQNLSAFDFLFLTAGKIGTIFKKCNS